MRCGGGWINYAIQTDGYIIPCPTMWGMKKYYLGNITDTDPLKLKKIFVDQPPCANAQFSMFVADDVYMQTLQNDGLMKLTAKSATQLQNLWKL